MMLHVTENVAYTFRITIGWKFELLLIGLKNDDMDRNNMITTYDTAICDAASEKLGKKMSEEKSLDHQRSSGRERGEI